MSVGDNMRGLMGWWCLIGLGLVHGVPLKRMWCRRLRLRRPEISKKNLLRPMADFGAFWGKNAPVWQPTKVDAETLRNRSGLVCSS